MTEAEVIPVAERLTASGRQADAKALLLSVHARPADWSTMYGFSAMLLLARCYRAEHDFDAAREAIRNAVGRARDAGSLAAEAVALEGAALIEREDGRIRLAGEYFMASAEAEGRLGNLEGRAAALSNYANMLTNHDIEGGEELLREALRDAASVGSPALACTDNLAGELSRQGRYDEAAEYSEIAVSGFLAAGLLFDAYIALRTLSTILDGAGRKEDSAAAFVRAHDLIRDLRREEVDDKHYALYPERVSQIEAETREIVKKSGILDDDVFKMLAEENPELSDPVDIVIGLHATVASEAQEKGFEQLESGEYAAAIESMYTAREHWQQLGALHSLVTIDYHLALAFTEVGDMERALPLVFSARTLARELGDAWREGMALSLLGRIGGGLSGRDDLDFFLSAQALEPCTRRQLGFPPDIDVPTDGGTVDGQIASRCSDAGAFDLAESYFEKTLAVAREIPATAGYRYIYRLGNFHGMLRRAGRLDRAAEILTELRTAVAELPADPRIARVLARATARDAYYAGERTREVLDGLLAECRAYEEGRDQAKGLDLTGFAAEADPPYEEAAQVALDLDDCVLALGLLERGAARTLLEAIEGDAAAEPADLGALPRIGKDVGITLFPDRDTITLLALDGADGSVNRSVLDDTDPPLWRAVIAFTDSADSERRGPASDGALGAVLEHPSFHRLAEAITGLVPQGRKAWLVPHGYLHNAPLQLLPAPADRYGIMPSLAIAARLTPSRPLYSPAGAGGAGSRGHLAIAACGDSVADLPFARAEARLIAGEAGAVAVGGECTIGWLEAAVTATTSILHIACHGRFDRARPARSGLVLAAAPEEQLAGTSTARLLTLPEVARLPLDGITVVLSACSSGMESVRASEPTGLVSALLSAGAAAVIAAQWPIGDLSAMLVMTRFYERLAQQPSAADLLAALDAAASDVRGMTAADLVDYGFQSADRLIALGAPPGEAGGIAGRCLRYALSVLGDQQTAGVVASVMAGEDPYGQLAALRTLRPSPASGAVARPFTDAAHWGAFKVVGRTTVGSER